jgi:hypothetical protein
LLLVNLTPILIGFSVFLLTKVKISQEFSFNLNRMQYLNEYSIFYAVVICSAEPACCRIGGARRKGTLGPAGSLPSMRENLLAIQATTDNGEAIRGGRQSKAAKDHPNALKEPDRRRAAA